MRSILLGFAAGVVLLHQLPALPAGAFFAAAGLFGLALATIGRLRPWLGLPAGVLLGLAFAGWSAGAALAHRLPAELEGETLHVEGRITGLPRSEGYRSVFVFRPQRFPGAKLPHPPRHLRLSWYDPPPGLRAGQHWTFEVRLKRPRGLMNPGAFDYERWLFTQRIDAVGYVREAGTMRPGAPGVDRFRQSLGER
ncbi:DUF4131 domain-containing protein, partial [Ectothiorhodospiraceae bacterium WFHF3C12]|nr:DUF4131 domain-containing protein [Ectothiorhodospiraceae bacterium WFHF3C12]